MDLYSDMHIRYPMACGNEAMKVVYGACVRMASPLGLVLDDAHADDGRAVADQLALHAHRHGDTLA